jgi:hypothetical protein
MVLCFLQTVILLNFMRLPWKVVFRESSNKKFCIFAALNLNKLAHYKNYRRRDIDANAGAYRD